MRKETAQSIIAAGEIGAKYDSVAKNLWHVSYDQEGHILRGPGDKLAA
ncbi:MAG: hypothetical protein IJ058_00100 [Lachnospiraceae bacterium]|nr:hypothetical protein [Lachnospiraceae bacterium]